MNKKRTTFWMSMVSMTAASLLSAQTNSLSTSNLDLKANPGADFYRYATGGWSDANPIPDEYARYGSFDKLRENNLKQLQELVEELGKTNATMGSAAQKIGDLYRLGMNESRLNKEKAQPLFKQLERIKNAATREELVSIAALMQTEGIQPFLDLMVGPDDKNSSQNLLILAQGGLGLPDRDYYVAKDKTSNALRKGYRLLIEKQFVNAGYPIKEARKAAKSILKLETELALAHYTKEKTREPELNYHKFALTQLEDSVCTFGWKNFLKMAGAEKATWVNVCQPEALAAAANSMNSIPLDEFKNYLIWCLLDESAEFLSDEFEATNFEFFGLQLSGAKMNQPRWKRTLGVVDEALGEELGKLYVAKYFPPQAKERMIQLVSNLKVALGERIQQSTWMSAQTKVKALEKLSTFIVKIGYPDTWRDYSGLKITEQSYWENICEARRFEYKFQMGKLSKPADKTEWLMTPQTVNAYYNPTTNEICFPAGILQAPFFYLDGDDAINYGAIGVVIGHEMSHGFDDQGSMYDKDGNMVNWWSETDATSFNERTKVLVDHFNQIVVLGDTTHANGSFTLGENIADNGGVQISLQAFGHTKQGQSTDKIDNFTPEQRFFLAYANLWAGNIRDAEIQRLTKTDPHSLAKWRVNGTLPHIDAWYKAFSIPESSPLFIPKAKRADIW